jgi:thiol-disulfide isomerase/thioredoxin
MKRPLILVAALVAVAALAFAFYRYEMPRAPAGVTEAVAPSAVPDAASVSAAATKEPPVPGAKARSAGRRKFRMRPHAAPRPLSDIRFMDGGGRAVSLADFRGRVVLLNLWATWCVPCITEMPALDRLQAELGGPDFEVVALSIDVGGLAAAQKFYRALGLKALGIYIDKYANSKRALKVPGIPTTLLIDGAGREVARLAGPAEWDSPEAIALIRRYLEQPPGTRQETAENKKRGS